MSTEKERIKIYKKYFDFCYCYAVNDYQWTFFKYYQQNCLNTYVNLLVEENLEKIIMLYITNIDLDLVKKLTYSYAYCSQYNCTVPAPKYNIAGNYTHAIAYRDFLVEEYIQKGTNINDVKEVIKNLNYYNTPSIQGSPLAVYTVLRHWYS